MQKTMQKTGLTRCYISPSSATQLNDGEDGMGEGFFINKLNTKTAEVRNNCICGLCIGDIINILENGISGHPNQFVSVKERKFQPYHLYYTFDGIDNTDSKMPKNINDFINGLVKDEIRFEGLSKGLAAMSYPIEMDDETFFRKINSGPMNFSPIPF